MNEYKEGEIKIKSIRKYSLLPNESNNLSLPKFSKILSVESLNEEIILNALVNPEEEEIEERKIRIYENDEDIENSIINFIFIGTVGFPKINRLYHIFVSEKVEIKNGIENQETPVDHMWEVKRPQYIVQKTQVGKNNEKDNMKNYYHSLDEYIKAWGKEIDYDMVVIFRWDWTKHTEDNGEKEYVRRFGTNCEVIEIYCYQQKTKQLFVDVVKIKREEEETVKAFLMPFWGNVKKLWYPLS